MLILICCKLLVIISPIDAKTGRHNSTNKVLKEDGILSAEEFNEERDKLVTEQEELQTILYYYFAYFSRP